MDDGFSGVARTWSDGASGGDLVTFFLYMGVDVSTLNPADRMEAFESSPTARDLPLRHGSFSKFCGLGQSGARPGQGHEAGAQADVRSPLPGRWYPLLAARCRLLLFPIFPSSCRSSFIVPTCMSFAARLLLLPKRKRRWCGKCNKTHDLGAVQIEFSGEGI